MEKVETFINLESIREFLKEESENFSEQQLQEFVNYVEVDFYDWLRTNLNSFLAEKKSKIYFWIKANSWEEGKNQILPNFLMTSKTVSPKPLLKACVAARFQGSIAK